MRKILSFLLVCSLLLALTACGNTPAQTEDPVDTAPQDTVVEDAPLLVMSQNVCSTDEPGENNLADRTERFRQLVQTLQPDIISTQESNSGLCNTYQSLFGETYTMLADFPDESGISKYGTSNTILFRTDRFELLETKTFWLSDTPEQKSMVEACKSPRSCTWALLKDKMTGQEFILCNTHFDWGDEAVRLQQFEILWKVMEPYSSKYPTILTGDFNAEPNGSVYAAASAKLYDSYVTAKENTSKTDHTYHGFYEENEIPCRIDYCFYSQQLTADSFRILTDQFGGYVSDHYGILTELRFQ